MIETPHRFEWKLHGRTLSAAFRSSCHVYRSELSRLSSSSPGGLPRWVVLDRLMITVKRFGLPSFTRFLQSDLAEFARSSNLTYCPEEFVSPVRPGRCRRQSGAGPHATTARNALGETDSRRR
jgi:hypothetical protein